MSEMFLNLAYEDTYEDPREFDRFAENERRHGPCEDSQEFLAEACQLGLMPEESDHEHGSPLNFQSKEGVSVHNGIGWFDPYYPQPPKR